MCEICLQLTIKTPEKHQTCIFLHKDSILSLYGNIQIWHRSGVFIVKFETYFAPCSIVSIVDFEHVIPDWFLVEITLCKVAGRYKSCVLINHKTYEEVFINFFQSYRIFLWNS